MQRCSTICPFARDARKAWVKFSHGNKTREAPWPVGWAYGANQLAEAAMGSQHRADSLQLTWEAALQELFMQLKWVPGEQCWLSCFPVQHFDLTSRGAVKSSPPQKVSWGSGDAVRPLVALGFGSSPEQGHQDRAGLWEICPPQSLCCP